MYKLTWSTKVQIKAHSFRQWTLNIHKFNVYIILNGYINQTSIQEQCANASKNGTAGNKVFIRVKVVKMILKQNGPITALLMTEQPNKSRVSVWRPVGAAMFGHERADLHLKYVTFNIYGAPPATLLPPTALLD